MKPFRIACVAPGTRIEPSISARAQAIAAAAYGDRVELVFHPQCYDSAGHFAGDDAARGAALVEMANDPSFDAVWFARGGYGACRVAESAIAQLNSHARAKTYLGYSDIGFVLAGLARAGFAHIAHGPMPVDIVREGGEAAVLRGLKWLVERDAASLEGSGSKPAMAFNLTILSQLLGTPLEPDFSGRVIMLEDVGEYMYRLDRYFFHVTSNPNVKRCAGLMLGRCSAIPKNDPDFLLDEVEVARLWCERSGIPYLGRADVGHDSDNKVVVFG